MSSGKAPGGARRLWLWGPPVLWAGLIFFLSSRTDTSFVPGGPDWLWHGMLYAVLGALALRAFSTTARRRPAPAAAVAALLACTLYGASDEIHQSLVPRRTPDWRDLAADAAGSTAGIVAGGALFSALARRAA